MVAQNGFDAHLRNTGFTQTLLCEDTDTSDDNLLTIEEAVLLFADFLELDQIDESEDSDIDLSASYANFIELYNIDEESAEHIASTILETTNKMFGDAEDDTAIHFLRQLAKPMEFERGYPNQEGMTPLKNEIGSKALLKMHPVSKVKDAFGNLGFSAEKYTYFPRGKNRYGHEAETRDPSQAYNSQGGFPLMNPILNVSTSSNANLAKKLPSNRAYESVDSVGLGSPMHFRVMSKLTGEYVTKLGVPKEEVDQIADDLNQLFQEQLAANPDLIAEFHAATSMPSEIPATNLQEGLNDHSKIAGYASYLSKTTARLDGGALVATDTVALTALNDFKSTQKLLQERRARFGEDNEDPREATKLPGRKR